MNPDLLFGALGAERMAGSGAYLLRTALDPEALASVWLSVSYDLCGNAAVPATSYCDAIWVHASSGFLVTAKTWQVQGLPTTPPLVKQACPTLVIAGVGGSGKSTAVAELSTRMRVLRDPVSTSRRRRPDELDTSMYFMDTGSSSLSMRRSAYWAVPVRYRGEFYWHPVAATLLGRFSGDYDVHVVVDSHPLRLMWYRSMVPDCRVAWLHHGASLIGSRMPSRVQSSARTFLPYLESHPPDLVIDTSAVSITATVERLIALVES